jgi:hypothetical protein
VQVGAVHQVTDRAPEVVGWEMILVPGPVEHTLRRYQTLTHFGPILPLTMPQQEARSTATHEGFQRRLPNDVIEDRPLGYWVALRLPM